MLEKLTEREAGLILEIQRATYEHIFPSLRLISVTIQTKSPDIFFFYDGPISEDNLESLNLIDTYFGVDYFKGLEKGSWEYITGSTPIFT
jgi:hypothetical protein